MWASAELRRARRAGSSRTAMQPRAQSPSRWALLHGDAAHKFVDASFDFEIDRRGRPRPSRDRDVGRKIHAARLSRARLPQPAHAPLVDRRRLRRTNRRRRRAVANPRATDRGRRLPLRRERRDVRERGGAARALPHRLVPVQPEAVGPRRAAAERGRVCGAGGGGRARDELSGSTRRRRRRRRGRRGRVDRLARQPRLAPATPTAARSSCGAPRCRRSPTRRRRHPRRPARGAAAAAGVGGGARRGGLAAAAYELQLPPKGSRKADCVKVLAHRSFHRYVTRRKAGGRQSVADGAKSIKSALADPPPQRGDALGESRDLLRSWAPPTSATLR